MSLQQMKACLLKALAPILLITGCSQDAYDLIILNGTVVDGPGAAR